MKKKTWALITLGVLLLAFAAAGALVIYVDPFQIYRPASRFIPPLDNTTQVYSNAGVVRNWEYDSVSVGSSVTENNSPYLMDELFGGRFIKLSTSAGTAFNHALLMDLAFDHHDIRTVVYALDVYSFIGQTDETGSDVPMYLYDDNPLNDVQYWFNRSVLGSFLPRCLRTWGQTPDDSLRESMYDWSGRDVYGITYALNGCVFAEPAQMLGEDAFLENASANLQVNLIPFITAHPETQFYIYFPPYSAAEWASMYNKGTFHALAALRGLCYDMLSGYENVTIYDFTTREDWVLVIDNYKDPLHYGDWINDALVTCIARGEYAVADRAQLDASTQKLFGWVMQIIGAGAWVFN